MIAEGLPSRAIDGPRSHHIAYADALRAAAIFAVVLHHLIYLTKPTIGNHRPYDLGYLGIWGVNCFFVLSGYLLGRPYIAMLLDEKRRVPSIRLFYLRRFLRIYPLYLVAIAFSVCAMLVTFHKWPAVIDVILHVFMIHTLSERYAISLNGPLWTMSVDAEYYLLLPLLSMALAFILRNTSPRFRITVVFSTLVATFGASILFRYEIASYVPATVDSFSLAIVMVRNIFGFAGTFALGMLLAALALLHKGRVAKRPIFFAALLTIGVIIAVAQLLALVVFPFLRAPVFADFQLAIWDPVAAVSVSLIFYALSEGDLPLISRLTRTKYVAAGAAVSYAVYLIHWPIITAVSTMLDQPQGTPAFFEVGSISVIIVGILSYVLHRFVERPILEIKDSLRDLEGASSDRAAGRGLRAEG